MTEVTWTLTAENTTAATLSALRDSDDRVPAFPAEGQRLEHICYGDGEADYAITTTSEPTPGGHAPVWMYQASELLEQYGIRSRIYASDGRSH